MRLDRDVIEVLCVACRVFGQADDVRTTSVASAAAALAALRMMPFDVLLTSCDVVGTPVWPLAAKVRRVRPGLHWWLIGRDLSDTDEVLARTLGVTRILDAAPTADLIRSTLARPATTQKPTLRPTPQAEAAEADMATPLALQE